jgi:hypothetical protein
MADYTYEQLKVMTVAQLREIASGLEDKSLEGQTTMHKEQILPLLCKIMGIHTHHAAVGAKKTAIKSFIHKLRTQRDAALASRDTAKLPHLRQQIHALKRRLRRMAGQSA